MPAIDVSELLTDPDFAQAFKVERRTEGVNDKGRADVFATKLDAIGAVLPMPAPVNRQPAEQNLPKWIAVYTGFALRGPASGYQPDFVLWNGDRYIVDDVQDWTEYGAGFVMATCSSVSRLDRPPA